MKDKAKVWGAFKMKVWKNGILFDSVAEENLIVDAGFELVQQLLSSAAADKHISKIAFGSLESGEPIQPTADMTAIPNQYFDKAFDSVTFPSPRSVSFNWSLLGTEGNGEDISYFGLLNADDELFAAKARAPLMKTSEFVLEGTWIIHY